MPLPLPNSLWPPPGLEMVHRDLSFWSAWWAGSPDMLETVYGGFGPYGRNRNQNQSWAARGIVPTIRRLFWGEKPRPGESQSKLHVPVASEIAQISADLLFGQPPSVTITDEADKATQDRLDLLLSDRAATQLHEAAETCAALGHVYLRVGWDRDIDPTGPLMSVVDADAAFAKYAYGHLIEVTFVREWDFGNGEILRHLELHEVGMIWHAAYLGDFRNIGRQVPLDMHPQTQDVSVDGMFADDSHAGSGVETGLDILDVVGVANQRSKTWRHLPAARDLGAADIAGVEGALDALDDCYCVDEETEILTDHGWVGFEDLQAGATVLTLNHSSGMSEWQPVEQVHVFPAKPREMISMEQRGHSSLTTPSHRWAVERPYFRRPGANGAKEGRYKAKQGMERTWATTETLGNDDTVAVAADHADLPEQPKYDDAFVEAVAWFWTEGHIRKLRDGSPGANVTIAQQADVNADNCDRIRACLRRAFGPAVDYFPRMGKRLDIVPRWRDEYYPSRNRCDFVLNAAAGRMLQEAAPGRVPAHEFLLSLTRAQLELFIGVSMLADNSGQNSLSQKGRPAAEAFQFACTLAGYGTSLTERKFQPHWSHHGQTSMWQVRIRSQRVLWAGRALRNAERVTYDGQVWCPQTANGTWLARRRGTVYFTGNSSWMRDIRHGRSRIHVPMHMLEPGGRGQGDRFDLDRELYVGLAAPPDGALQLTATQFAIRYEEHHQTAIALLERIVGGAGYSLQTFGLDKATTAQTATESWARQNRTQNTRNGKLRHWNRALLDLAKLLLAVDNAQFGGSNNVDADVTVQFADTVSDSQLVRAQTAQLLRSAEAASTRTLVELVHNDWDGDQIDAEVKRIEGDATAQPVPGVGVGSHGTDPSQPVPDGNVFNGGLGNQ